MRKSYFSKWMLYGALAFSVTGFVGCSEDYDDEIAGLETRIDGLEQSLKQLEGKIKEGAVITKVTPTENGLSVTLSDGSSYELKNGANGKDGVDGTNGVDGTPGSVISIDSESGNWLIDGNDTGMPSRGAQGIQGEKGDKGDQGAQGIQGEKGDKGDQGAQGIQGEKGDKGDQGAQGIQGEKGDKGDQGEQGIQGEKGDKGDQGEQGIQGEKGDKGDQGEQGIQGEQGLQGKSVYYIPDTDPTSPTYGQWLKVVEDPAAAVMFSTPVLTEEEAPLYWKTPDAITAVWDSESGKLVFDNIKDDQGNPVTGYTIDLSGTLLSMAFVPEVISKDLGMGIIDFYSLMKWEKETGWYQVASNTPIVTYRMNPANANLKDVKWAFVDRTVTSRAGSNADFKALVSIVKDAADNDFVQGKQASFKDFTLRLNSKLSSLAKDQSAIVALQATTVNGDIVSDYANVQSTELKEFALINEKKYDEDQTEYFFIPAVNSTNDDDAPAFSKAADIELVYNQSLDLADYVELWAGKGFNGYVRDLDGITPVYTYRKIDKYIDPNDHVTDQEKFVSDPVGEKGTISVNKEWLENGDAAIGRTPVFKVIAKVANEEMAIGYIKVKIVKEPTQDKGTLKVAGAEGTLNYSALPGNIAITWDRFNKEVYDALKISAADFGANFKVKTLTANTPAGISVNLPDASAVTSTNLPGIVIDKSIVSEYGKETKGEVVVIYESKDKYKYPNVEISFKYTITHNETLPEFAPSYHFVENNTDYVLVKGKTNSVYEMKATLKEGFKGYLASYQIPANHSGLYFRHNPDPIYANETAGIRIIGTDWQDQEIELVTPLAAGETKREMHVQLVTNADNGSKCLVNYVVRFVSPFKVTVDPVTLKTKAGAETTADLKNAIKIADRAFKIENGELKEVAGNVLFANGQYTQAAAGYTNLSSIVEFTSYAVVDTENKFGGYLKIKDMQTQPNIISWNNAGSELLKDEQATSKVVVTFKDMAAVEATGVINVLCRANSN